MQLSFFRLDSNRLSLYPIGGIRLRLHLNYYLSLFL